MLGLNVLVGILLLLLGRRLFWLFVAAVGFVVGMNLAAQYLADQSFWVIMVAGLVAGAVGAVLAILFQRIAVALAGFLAGSYLSTFLLATLGIDMGQFAWLVSLIGGIIGAVLVFVLFDWALILLSSLVGASLVAPVVSADPQTQTVMFLLLAVIGIVVQGSWLWREPEATRASRRPARRRRRAG